jgi:hypothetical protein
VTCGTINVLKAWGYPVVTDYFSGHFKRENGNKLSYFGWGIPARRGIRKTVMRFFTRWW